MKRYQYKGPCEVDGCGAVLEEWTHLNRTEPGGPDTWVPTRTGLLCPDHRGDNLPVCAVCQKKQRPKGSQVADWPGTTMRGVGGLCLHCYQTDKAAVQAGELDRAVESYYKKSGRIGQ